MLLTKSRLYEKNLFKISKNRLFYVENKKEYISYASRRYFITPRILYDSEKAMFILENDLLHLIPHYGPSCVLEKACELGKVNVINYFYGYLEDRIYMNICYERGYWKIGDYIHKKFVGMDVDNGYYENDQGEWW